MAENTNTLKFRRGLESQIEQNGNNLIYGSINFAVDNPGLFIDVYDKYDQTGKPTEDAKLTRKRVSDIIVFDDYEELLGSTQYNETLSGYDYNDNTDTAPSLKAYPKWNTNALYYIVNENALLKYIPSPQGEGVPGSWKRVNADLDKVAQRFQTLVGTKDDNRNTISLHGIKNDLIGVDTDLFETDVPNKTPKKSLYGLKNTLIGTYEEVDNPASTTPTYGGAGTFKGDTIGALQSALVHLQDYTLAELAALDDSLTGTGLPSNVDSLGDLYNYLITHNAALGENGTVTSFPQMTQLLDEKMRLADAMTFAGVLNESKSLPTDASKVKAGDTYKVGHLGYFENNIYVSVDTVPTDKADFAVYIGDLIVANKDGQLDFTHISSGYEAENEAALRYKNEALYLVNPVGVNLGSVQMVGSNDSNVTVSASNTTGALGDSITYNFQLEWDTF